LKWRRSSRNLLGTVLKEGFVLDKLSPTATLFAGMQWLFFIFANTIVVPISIGFAFHLSPQDVAVAIKSTFIITGFACVIQGTWGHRLSLMEGHSGLWWGLILSLSASASSVGTSLSVIGGAIVSGMILATAVMVLLSGLNLIHWLKKIFTPAVMSVYIFLLAVQLVLIFFKGMLKVTEEGYLDIPVSGLSIFIVLLVSLISIKGKGILKNFSILIGIIIGWILYAYFFSTDVPIENGSLSNLKLFPWGKINFEIGIVLASFVTGLLNMTNSIASIQAAEKLYGIKVDNKRYRLSFLFSGFFTLIAACFGLVPYAPFTSSIGFLESTKILDRRPFILGGVLFVALGLIPALGSFLTTLPITVGNAVLFIAYLQLFGTAIKSMQAFPINSITIFRLAVPILTGICLMNMEQVAFNSFPVYIRPLISNGLLVGILLSIILEHSVSWSKYETIEKNPKKHIV
jgi:xanthine/uracil permease